MPEVPVIASPRRVVIVDDHAAFADMFQVALEAVTDLVCVGTAGTLAEALRIVADTDPDLVVVDLALGTEDGLEVVRQLRADRPDVVLVVASARSDTSALATVAMAGGNGFAPKKGTFRELLAILRSAQTGSMSVAPTLLPDAAAAAPNDGSPLRLTTREAEVLALMGTGASVPAIARLLRISLSTCRSHVRSVHAKLGARTQLEAVLKARQIGLIDATE
jgi:DNA-binding NarL/FixJ family response regulator